MMIEDSLENQVGYGRKGRAMNRSSGLARLVRWLSVIGVVVATSPVAGQARAEILAGAAVSVITPSRLLPISGGMGIPQPAREKRGELTARALVLRKGDVSVAIVALDLLGFPSVLGDRVRARSAALHRITS